MKRATFSIFACLTVAALSANPVLAADKKGGVEAELVAAVNAMTKAWVASDVKGMTMMLSKDMCSAWDLDMQGRPAAMANTMEVMSMMTGMSAQMKQMGMTGDMVNDKVHCHASGTLGVCEVEGHSTMSMPGMPAMTMMFRSTEVLEKQKGGWKFIHHHGSLAKPIPMPAKSMAFDDMDKVAWQDAPGMPKGAKTAMIWMNPMTGAMAALMKIGDEGMNEPRHIHPFSATITVLKGTFSTTGPDGKMTDYGPGDVIYRAPMEPHTTTVKPGSIALIVTDGPMMTTYLPEGK